MTNLADTYPYLYEIMWQGLNRVSALMNSEAVLRNGGSAEGSILTLPNVDRSRKCSRKRQKTSPTKAKKSKS